MPLLEQQAVVPFDMEVPRTQPDIQLTGLKIDDLVNSIRSTTKVVFLDPGRWSERLSDIGPKMWEREEWVSSKVLPRRRAKRAGFNAL